jgi:transmembrane sensor
MSPRKPKLPTQILEQAAEWLVEMDRDDVDRATRQRFDEWLRRSPEHVRAFLEMLPIWEQGAQPRSSSHIDPERLIAEVMGAASNVVPLNAHAGPPSGIHSEARPKLQVWLSIAASVLLVAFLSMWLYIQHNTYSTGIGEQRSVALDDGSVVQLNTRSRIRIRYGKHERGIDLIEGQALFEVAHDAGRPFVVHGGNANIRAVGTQFDVYRKQTGTTVTVVEGRVTIIPETNRRNTGTGRPEFLAAGEQATITPSSVESNDGADVAAAIAWTQRRLMFQKTTLAEVVREFNRYNERPLRVDDPQLQEFLISGTFSSTDPSPLLRFLREQPGMRIVESRDEVRIDRTP